MRGFLDDIEAIDPELALPWVATPYFDVVPADLSVDGLQQILDDSRDLNGWRDVPGVNYNVDLSPEDGTARRIKLSAAGDAISAPNRIIVSLPTGNGDPEHLGFLREPQIGEAILRTVVTHWSPDYALWTIGDYRPPQRTQRRQIPVGWLTYIPADTVLDREALPAVARMDEWSSGLVVRLGDEPMSVSIADILTVRVALGYSD